MRDTAALREAGHRSPDVHPAVGDDRTIVLGNEAVALGEFIVGARISDVHVARYVAAADDAAASSAQRERSRAGLNNRGRTPPAEPRRSRRIASVFSSRTTDCSAELAISGALDATIANRAAPDGRSVHGSGW